ncbi:hypothetical protein RRG08_044237 [Elysia crispata]|uniref:Uncharacterized protein n=1 Tax=Elysia crispata TaxID=231223 RepID=A0AAE1CNT4_9GAST|nr:hypothetical protein RRG08_044237 [Elysia crispata]
MSYISDPESCHHIKFLTSIYHLAAKSVLRPLYQPIRRIYGRNQAGNTSRVITVCDILWSGRLDDFRGKGRITDSGHWSVQGFKVNTALMSSL